MLLMTLGGLKMGSDQCHYHYATDYRNQWRSLPPYSFKEASYAKRLQELALHSHLLQNIYFNVSSTALKTPLPFLSPTLREALKP
ncbi:hypothetical protein NSTCB13_06532 [Nostoc sp. DSM 114160]|jgi:hypothetical protein